MTNENPAPAAPVSIRPNALIEMLYASSSIAPLYFPGSNDRKPPPEMAPPFTEMPTPVGKLEPYVQIERSEVAAIRRKTQVSGKSNPVDGHPDRAERCVSGGRYRGGESAGSEARGEVDRTQSYRADGDGCRQRDFQLSRAANLQAPAR